MNMQQIRALARNQGIKPGKASKLKLVREIQRQEGNFDCFATDIEAQCDQTQCLWQEDCSTLARKNLP